MSDDLSAIFLPPTMGVFVLAATEVADDESQRSVKSAPLSDDGQALNSVAPSVAAPVANEPAEEQEISNQAAKPKPPKYEPPDYSEKEKATPTSFID